MKLLPVLFLSLVWSFSNGQKVINDANVEVRSVGSFTGVSISGGIDLYISQGDEALAVSASRTQYREAIKTEIKNGVLRIWYESKGFNVSVNENRRLKAYVSCKAVKSIQASGGSDVMVEGTIKSDDLTIALSGGADFKGIVDVATVTVKQSGGSDVNISGKAGNLVIDASGGSDFNGYDLISDICHVESSGGSDAEVTANKELTVRASGASDVYYKGTPQVKEVKASGASSVKAKS